MSALMKTLRILCVAQGVAAMTLLAGAAHASVTVNCAKGQTIAAALAANPPANGGLLLLVNGTCIEDVVVNRFSETTIQGNPAAILQPAHATDTAVTAFSLLDLSDVSIDGGSTAVSASHAYVRLVHSSISGAGIGVSIWI
jgi:hypothetical protein